MNSRAPWTLVVSLASALSLAADPRQSQDARAAAGESTAKLTPDGAHLVFAADPDGDGALELFSVSTEGASAPVRLGGPLASPIGRPWTLTADGRGVVFVAGGLFVAPVDGSAPALALAHDVVQDFALAPSGKRVAYRAGPSSLYAGLYVAALDGTGAPLELVAPNPRGEVLRYAFAPDERSLVFTSLHAGGRASRLYRVALDGGAPVELDPTCASVSDFAITSDGERVLFRAHGASESRLALFSAPLDGTEGAVQLCDPAAPDADVQAFAPSADGAWVVFLSDRGRNGRNDLLSARTDASAAPVSLAAALAPEASVVATFALDAGSERVVYAADPHRAEQFELYASALDGRSAPVRLDAPSASGSAGWYTLLPDGASALYEVHDGSAMSTLWRVALADPSRRAELARVRAPSDFALSLNGRRLAFLEHLEQRAELHALACDGATPPVRRQEVAASGFQLGADGSWCLARATDAGSSAKGASSRWLRIPLDGASPALALDAWPPAGATKGARASSIGAASGGRMALDGDAGFRDFSFGLSGSSTPTGEKPECKLWWNDGFWWGDLYDDASQDHHVFRLDWASQTWLDTGIALDTRGSSKGDILWDAKSRKLYVASHIFSTDAHSTASNFGRLFRYTYEGKAYTRDAGFPVDITDGNAEALTIAKDSTGRLWATWVEDQQVMINHSAGTGEDTDEKWDTPVLLPVDPSTATGLTTDEISAIIAFGDRVGVMWSNQATTHTYFSVHLDADPPELWQTPEIVLPEGVNCASLCSDDLFSLKTLDGRVFVALKTSQVGPDDALILVCARAIDGAWSSTVFGRVQDHHTRPVLLLDQQSREMYVFATHPEDSGAVFYKHTPLDDIQFEPGLGTPFIQNAVDVTINNATSTKQNLDSQTHLVVLASDHDTRFYLHNVLDLGGGPLPPAISTFTPASGTVGTPVTIDGSNLATTTALSFGGTSASFTVVSDSELTTAVPDGATTGRIVVTNAAGTATSASDFTVTPRAPTITSFAPQSGRVGTVVTLDGTDLDGASDVAFAGTSASFSVVSSTSLQATVPAGASSGPITVTTPGGSATSPGDFTVTQGAPTIGTFLPASGQVGAIVKLDGTELDGATDVSFNGTSAAFSVASGSTTSLEATVPAGATTGRITVTTPAGTATSASDFVVRHTPTIVSFSPGKGPIGGDVTIEGMGFDDTTAVRFNGKIATFTLAGSTRIDAAVPAGATTGRITVTTPLGTVASAHDYTVERAPSIVSFSPARGPVGAAILIEGAEFTGAAAVKIDGKSAPFTLQSGKRILLIVPLGATTGRITVTTPAGTGTSSTDFTVSGGRP